MASPEYSDNFEPPKREDGSIFELGRGGMRVTYMAFDTDPHCNAANPGIFGNANARERIASRVSNGWVLAEEQLN